MDMVINMGLLVINLMFEVVKIGDIGKGFVMVL